jgi:hypothetical protein
MEQTAVSWLEQILRQNCGAEFIQLNEQIFDKAKEMEKEQIMQTRQDIYHTGDLDNEQYYNETFKSE